MLRTKKKVERVVRKLKSRTFLDPTNDIGFKEIFRFKSLLKNFLNSLRHRTGVQLDCEFGNDVSGGRRQFDYARSCKV